MTKLTTHVLDVYSGKPGQGIKVELYLIKGDKREKLNKEYKKKFNFPFIIAVKGKNKKEILNIFRQRIRNDINSEFEEAKKQVKKIANFRLSEIFK